MYNTHEHTFTHKHMNIRTQHTNTIIRHRDHSHTYIHNNPYIETQHTPSCICSQTYKYTYKHTYDTNKHNTQGKHTYIDLYTNRHTTFTYTQTKHTHIYIHIYIQTHYAQHPCNTLSSTIHTQAQTHTQAQSPKPWTYHPAVREAGGMPMSCVSWDPVLS